ncbi:protocadherin-9-like isoform X2 [Lampetra fluviatilis]
MWALRCAVALLAPLLPLLLLALPWGLADEVSYRVPEELPPGKLIGSLARDLGLREPSATAGAVSGAAGGGGGGGVRLSYKVVSKSDGPPMVRVDNVTGDVFSTEVPLDRERACPGPAERRDGAPCHVDVQVVVLPNEHFRLVKVRIYLEDINDNSPMFSAPVLNVTVPENSPLGARFPLPTATDADAGRNGVQRYSLARRDDAFALEVVDSADAEKSPQLVVRAPLDRERRDSYELRLRAEDGGRPPRTGTAVLRVIVGDLNDNSPAFERDQLEATVPEDAPPGTPVARPSASDPDAGANGEVVYSLAPRTAPASARLFEVDPATGEVRVRGALDREEAPSHRLLVLAADRGPSPTPATATVVVVLADVNDNAPAVAVHAIAAPVDGAVEVSEAAPPGTPVALVEVSDPDAEQNGAVTCRVEGADGGGPAASAPPFRLRRAYPNNANHYLLETSSALDFEARQEYDVRVVASDTGAPSLSGSATVRVRLRDENDNRPYFAPAVINASVYENGAPGAAVLTLRAFDRDGGANGALTYELGPRAPPVLRLDRATGALTVSEPLDREETALYRFTVVARDGGTPALEGDATVFLRVLDRNDNPPRFASREFNFFLSENLPSYSTVGVLSATDADEGRNALVTFSLVRDSDVFAINPVTGMIRANASFDRERVSAYEFDVRATDAGEPPRSATARVAIHVMDVNDNAPVVLMPATNSSFRVVSPAAGPGTQVAEIVALDGDGGPNAALSYSVVGGGGGGSGGGGGAERRPLFAVDPSTGNVTLSRALGPEHRGLHRVAVRVSDGGFPEPLSALALLHLFVNETLGDAALVREMVARSNRLPLDAAGPAGGGGGGGRAGAGSSAGPEGSRAGRYTILVAMAAGAAIVILLIVAVVLALRCRGGRVKNGGGGGGGGGAGVWRGKASENWLSASPGAHERDPSSKPTQAPYSIVTIEEAKGPGDEPTYQSIAEALEEACGGGGGGGIGGVGEDPRHTVIPRHSTFRPRDPSPDLLGRLPSRVTQPPPPPPPPPPPLPLSSSSSSSLLLSPELPSSAPAAAAAAAFSSLSESKRSLSSSGSEHYSASESSCSQQGARSAHGPAALPTSSASVSHRGKQSFADSGLGESDAMVTTSGSSCPYSSTSTTSTTASTTAAANATTTVTTSTAAANQRGRIRQTDSGLGEGEASSDDGGGHGGATAVVATVGGGGGGAGDERTVPDGCTWGVMQAETGPALKDLPDVTVFSTCTADCHKYGHSDNCWMPPGPASEAVAALPLRAFTLGRPRGTTAAAASAASAASSALVFPHGRGPPSSSPAAVGAVGAGGIVAVVSSSSSPVVVAAGPREAGKSRQADAYYNAFYSNNYRSHRPEMYQHHHHHQHHGGGGVGGVAGAEKIPLAELKARPFDDGDDDDDDDEEEEDEDEDMEGAGSEELPLTSQPYRQSSVPVGTPQDFGSKELYL